MNSISLTKIDQWLKSSGVFFTLIFLILVPTIFTGGEEYIGQAIIFSCAALLAVFIPTRFFHSDPLLKIILFSLLIFFITILASLPFSFDRYESLRELFLFSAALIVFLKCTSFIELPETIQKLLLWLTIGTGAFAAYGLYIFLGAEPFFRLGSVFYQQNAFAGFMLPTLFFSVGKAIYSSSNKKIFFWSGVSTFLLIVFFFTFARGAGLAFVGSFIATSVLLSWKKKVWLQRGSLLIIIGIVAILLALAVFSLKTRAPLRDTSLNSPLSNPVQIFQEETAEDNGMTARFHYLYDSSRIFISYPLFGVGWGAFGDAATRHREVLKNYTSDPHNIFARAFVEVGFIGGVALLIAVCGLVVMASLIVRRARDSDIEFLSFVVVGSFFSLIFQNLVNADWTFPSDLILFWLIAAMIVWLYSRTIHLERKPVSSFQNKILVFWALLAAVFGFVTFMSSVFFSEGTYLIQTGKLNQGLFSYQNAIRLDPLHPLYRRDVANVYLVIAAKEKNENLKKEYLRRAVIEIEQGLYSKRHDPYLFYLQAKSHLLLGDVVRAEKNFKKAIFEDRLMLLAAYRDLSNIYFEREDYQAITELLNPILGIYSEEAFRSTLWINPYKNEARRDVADLWVRFGLAELGLGNTSSSLRSFDTALVFSPEEKRAHNGLWCIKNGFFTTDSFRTCFYGSK